VQFDPTHLHQVLWNLCDNALQHGAPGNEEPVSLRIGRIASSGRPFLEVADRGVGIDPSNAERIFEPFFTDKAGGTGLTLTEASHVIHFDRWWNPAVENQATDRAFRIGQQKNVLVHKFICRGTLEEKIDALIRDKTALADDLLQEAYYRFLRAGRTHESEAHRRNSLFKIATNLARDAQRRRRVMPFFVADAVHEVAASDNLAERLEQRTDVGRALDALKPRDRAMLWLAYAEGSSHEEIATVLGVKRASVKLLLFRARRRLAELLGGWRAKGGA